ncbi:hypothetical protein FSP39_019609 [Pinctada imbricata]|uniref:THD domain-containing protein n=1 Tax=Pinctada imbricata TaxID=66713 RepID=A0AA88Y1J4_PINIB|nr:hypothetical protein FSP39_019609 [Pinctada imbricata]
MSVRCIAVMVFVLDVLVLSVVLALLWTMRSKNVDCIELCLPDPQGKMVCDCRVTRFKSVLEQEFIKSQSIEKEKLQKKRLETHKGRTKIHYFSPNSDWDMKPVAHLSGSTLTAEMTQEDKETPMAPIRKWEQGNNCYLQNGMILRNGRLVVPIDGLYHIYSFVDMYQDYTFDKMNETIPMSISMGVFRSNILRSEIPEEEMICAYRPYEKSRNNRFTVYDNYIGADVQLQAGDEVYIRVSNITYVKNPSRNVFGMHLL